QPAHQLGAAVAGRPDALRRAEGERVWQGGAEVRRPGDDGNQDGRHAPVLNRTKQQSFRSAPGSNVSDRGRFSAGGYRRAARAMAAILSAKFTWLSSSGA